MAVNGLSGAGIVTDTLATATQFIVQSNNVNSTFTGKVAPSLPTVKVGTGTWTLQYPCILKDLRIDQGVVAPWETVELTGTVQVASGATLRVTNTNTVGLAGEYFDCSPAGLQWVTETSNFVSLARITDVLAGLKVAYRAGSQSFGTNFDTDANGTRFQGGYAGRDYWVGRWTGKFLAETSGLYRFGSASDDGSMVFIDGQVAIINNYLQGYTGSQRMGALLDLTNGWHDIQVVFFEKTGGNALTVYMIPPGATATNGLPQRLLRHNLPVYVGRLTGGNLLSALDFTGVSAGVTFVGNEEAVFTGRVTGTNTTFSIVQNGAARQALAGDANLYGGQITVNKGRLALNTNGKYGPVEIAAGGTLEATNAVGLLGSYYNVTGVNVGNSNQTFASYTIMETGVVNTAVALYAGSDLAGSTFNFGQSNVGGTLFPAPFGPTGRSNFYAIWRGQFIAPVSGTYTFYTSSDDGSMLFINGQTVVNNNLFQAYTERSGTVSLTAGLHAMTIGFYQGGGDYGVSVSVALPGGSRQVLPNSMLRPVVAGIGPLSGLGGLSLPSDAAFLRIDETNATTYAGGASGVSSSAINKAGAQTLTLTGNNDAFLGTWYLTAGAIQVGNGSTNGTLGGAEINLAAGTTLIFNRSDNSVYTGRVSGAGSINQAGTGRVTLTNVATNFAGAVSLSGAGGLTLSSSNAVMNATAFSGAGTLKLANGGSVKATSAALGVPLAVEQLGALRLSATNSTLDRLTVGSNAVLNVEYVGGIANADYTLTVGTVAAPGGMGTVALSANGSGAGTLKISALEVGLGGVLAVSGKVAVSGSALTVTASQIFPRGSTLVGEFTATDGLDLTGVTLSAVGAGDDARLVYRDKRLYISRANGTMIIVR
jgi:autotransporter-associated beta strand protein